MENSARLIKENELGELLRLYKHLNEDDPALLLDDNLDKLWKEILNDPNLFHIVIEDQGMLVSSCTLAIIKNLTRGAKPYSVIENVVTHKDYRNRGLGRAVLQKAIEISEEKGCYKVMLLTGRKDKKVLEFYERAGFERGVKTGFIMKL